MPDIKYLKLLAEKYPNRKAVRTEIINLRAILALPKATEFFLSDIHMNPSLTNFTDVIVTRKTKLIRN